MSNLLNMIQMHDQMTKPSDYERVKALTNAWNKGDLKVGKNITKNEAEMLAANAYTKGLDFDVESNPLKKFAFNLANTATFGLLPDSIFKPDPSIGEMYHGENWSDYLAGGTGSLMGLITGVGGLGYGAYKGYKGIQNWKQMRNAKKVFDGTLVGDELALLGARNTPLLGKGPTGFSMRDVPGLPGPGVGRPGQIQGAPNLLQLTSPRRYGSDTQSVIDNMIRSGYIA